MQKILDLAAGFAKDFVIVFGEDKSQVMVFNKPEKTGLVDWKLAECLRNKHKASIR